MQVEAQKGELGGQHLGEKLWPSPQGHGAQPEAVSGSS